MGLTIFTPRVFQLPCFPLNCVSFSPFLRTACRQRWQLDNFSLEEPSVAPWAPSWWSPAGHVLKRAVCPWKALVDQEAINFLCWRNSDAFERCWRGNNPMQFQMAMDAVVWKELHVFGHPIDPVDVNQLVITATRQGFKQPFCTLCPYFHQDI